MAITKTSLDMRQLCYSSQGDRCAYYSEAGGFRLDYDYESSFSSQTQKQLIKLLQKVLIGLTCNVSSSVQCVM